MALYIQTNVSSLMAQSNLSKTQNALQTSFQRLSSGYRINSAADDAAGLGISDSMTAQIRSYAVAERNAMDGISMSQTADGASSQVGAMLARMRELAMQARNGSYTATDRGNLDVEFQQLVEEIDRISNSTEFNRVPLLNGKADAFEIQVGTRNNPMVDRIRLFDTRARYTGYRAYDVAPDGQRFLINTVLAEGDSPPLTVVLGWPDALGR